MIHGFEDAILSFGNKNLDGSPKYEAWEYFKKCYPDMSTPERFYNQLIALYTHYPFAAKEFYTYLKNTLDFETQEEYNKRIAENRLILAEYLDDDLLKVYRGVNAYSMSGEYAISYTLDKRVAEFFANRRLKGEPQVLEATFYINEIILFTDCRGEKEVIVMPECLEDLDFYFD